MEIASRRPSGRQGEPAQHPAGQQTLQQPRRQAHDHQKQQNLKDPLQGKTLVAQREQRNREQSLEALEIHPGAPFSAVVLARGQSEELLDRAENPAPQLPPRSRCGAPLALHIQLAPGTERQEDWDKAAVERFGMALSTG